MYPLSLRTLTLVALILAIVGCGKQVLLQKFASSEEQAVAKGYLDLLRQRQFESIEKAIDPSIAGPLMHQTLVAMAASIPAGKPMSVTLIGAQRFKSPDYSTLNLSFEYQFPAQWMVANLQVKEQGNIRTIIGFHVSPRPTSLEEKNRFRFGGKTPLQFLVLALVVVVPLFILYALILCITTRLKGRKWPWVIFIIVGIGKLSVDWTTGQWSSGLIFFQLFGASGVAQLYGPWIFAVSLPVGAIVFLLKRKELRVLEIPS